jgi:hypothetical protein
MEMEIRREQEVAARSSAKAQFLLTSAQGLKTALFEMEEESRVQPVE